MRRMATNGNTRALTSNFCVMKKLRRIDANKAHGPFDLSLKLIINIKVIRRVFPALLKAD